MADTAHTPAPWNVMGTHVFAADGALVCSALSLDHADIVEEANASHIAKCVNLHLELVEALTRLVREAELDGMREKAGWDCWLNLADKALAKAGAV